MPLSDVWKLDFEFNLFLANGCDNVDAILEQGNIKHLQKIVLC